MNVYTVHIRRHGLDPDKDIVLVKEGFCWPALFFSGLWALWHKMWLPALAIIFLSAGLGFATQLIGLDATTQSLIGGGASVLIAMLANDIRRHMLDRWGFAEAGVVCGGTRDAALLSFMQAHPDLTGAA